MNEHVSADELVAFARSIEGETIFTDKRKGFSVEVKGDGLRFLPQFSSQPRAFGREALEAALTRFAERRSFEVRDYPETRAAGQYWLFLLREYLATRRGGAARPR